MSWNIDVVYVNICIYVNFFSATHIFQLHHNNVILVSIPVLKMNLSGGR